MKPQIKRLSIIIAVTLLPVLLYTFFEVTTLNENEQMLSKVYNEQLDAVALGINQICEGIINSWVGEISIRANNLEAEETQLEDIIKNNKAIEAIVFIDTTNFDKTLFYTPFGKQKSKTAVNMIKGVIAYNMQNLVQMRKYMKMGYRKFYRLENSFDDAPLFALLPDDRETSYNLIIFAVSDKNFMDMLVSKRIDPLVTTKFSIEIDKLSKLEDEKEKNSSRVGQKIYDLWLFPNYYIGIAFNGQTIEELVGERTKTNLFLIALLNIVLIVGLVFVFMNTKKEIELSQIKTDFVANVSHEIRTPLSLISMFAETLELGRVPNEEKKQEYYTIIRRESERLGNIVNKILNFSQMEAQKKKYNFEYLDLNEIVNEIMETYQFHLLEKQVNYEIKLEENLPYIKMDKGTVSEAIINIIDNAVKYSKDEKHIEIITYKTNSVVGVKVKDNGIGIAKENLDKIFEKFFRSSSSLVHDTKGNGLGLTLVKHIMDVHKGKVSVESKLGKGSLFILEFPINIS